MLLEIFLFFEIVTIAFFIFAFISKQEVVWALTALFSATLAYNALGVQYYVYEYNATILAYQPVMTTFSYPYLGVINLVFFFLAIAFGVFDLFDKYGTKLKGA